MLRMDPNQTRFNGVWGRAIEADFPGGLAPAIRPMHLKQLKGGGGGAARLCYTRRRGVAALVLIKSND